MCMRTCDPGNSASWFYVSLAYDPAPPRRECFCLEENAKYHMAMAILKMADPVFPLPVSGCGSDPKNFVA